MSYRRASTEIVSVAVRCIIYIKRTNGFIWRSGNLKAFRLDGGLRNPVSVYYITLSCFLIYIAEPWPDLNAIPIFRRHARHLRVSLTILNGLMM